MGTIEDRVIYVRGNGFLTETGEWSNDIIDARLFSAESAKNMQMLRLMATNMSF